MREKHSGKQEGSKMTFWQENYTFIREVYDTRWIILQKYKKQINLAPF